jgi:hypothetical protein
MMQADISPAFDVRFGPSTEDVKLDPERRGSACCK